MEMANQIASGWHFNALLGGSPVNRPTSVVHTRNRNGRTLFHSSLNGTTAILSGLIQGLAGRTSMCSFVQHTYGGEIEQQLYKWPDSHKLRICILGGGFGGLYTTLRLESLVWPDDKKPQVLLVDQFDKIVFKPMLYELLSGEVDP